jgi:hypothetical protein
MKTEWKHRTVLEFDDKFFIVKDAKDSSIYRF